MKNKNTINAKGRESTPQFSPQKTSKMKNAISAGKLLLLTPLNIVQDKINVTVKKPPLELKTTGAIMLSAIKTAENKIINKNFLILIR